MSPNRWKVLACAIFLAAFSASDTANPPPVIGVASPHVVVAMSAEQPVPPVARTVIAPVIALENPPTVTVAAIPPLSAPPIAARPAPVAIPKLAAANPPDVTNTPPAASQTKHVPDTAAPSVAAVAPAAADSERPKLTFDRRILAVHNRERQDLGLQPLSWNPELAQSAQRWAEHLAETGRFEHAPENHVAPEGENLWAGTKGYYTPEAMVAAWIREKRYFRTGVFPDNSTTGRVEDIGHYTQVVWRATHEVGCAEAASASEDILVCRYAEAGNYRGERPF